MCHVDAVKFTRGQHHSVVLSGLCVRVFFLMFPLLSVFSM